MLNVKQISHQIKQKKNEVLTQTQNGDQETKKDGGETPEEPGGEAKDNEPVDEDERNLREKEQQVKQLNLMSERTNDVQPMFT